MTVSGLKTFRNLDDFSGMASDWFWETDADHKFCYFSRRMEEVTKFNSYALIGKKRDIIPSENLKDPKWVAHMADLAAHRPFHNFEYMMRRPHDGTLLWIRIAGEPQFDDAGTFTGYRGVGHDVTQEKVAIERLKTSNAALEERNRELDEARRIIERSAFEDPLTNLLNRRAFERDLATTLERANADVGLLHIDLDRFKWVNDTLGHPAGDQVLCTTATRLLVAVGTYGTVYRVGGDEFIVILAADIGPDQANWLGDSIVECMATPIHHEQQRTTVGASIGIAFGDGAQITPARLIARADVALYEAKRSGRNRVCQITPEILARMQARRQLAGDIPGGLERGEFFPLFQPQIDVSTGAVVGAEALVRWQHPQMGTIAPGVFLDVATELGMMAEIDQMMLRESLAVAARLRAQGLMLPSVSVNISSARLMDPHLSTDIEKYWLDKRCQLSVELLETIYFDETRESPQFNDNLAKLRAMGVRIETDDFGSGRASITGLLKVRPDRVKIDRTLIQAAVHDPVKRNVVAAIFDMIHALGIEGMAEGVEKQSDIDVIRKLGCDVFQGYALSHPLSEVDLAAFLVAKGSAVQMQTAGHMDLPKEA